MFSTMTKKGSFVNTILVTGVAGFIGFHLAKRLLKEGNTVVGLDNINDYYDIGLKEARLKHLLSENGFKWHRADITDVAKLESIFAESKPQFVINLAAQAGVRHSIKYPHSYIQSNVVGFMNVLECCRHAKIEHLVFASSSSVYGANGRVPFSIHHNVDHPLSIYAATKKSNEMMAHAYSSLYSLPCTGLRFFTVYGPWGRPDMAYFSFTKAVLDGKTIDVFNNGNLERDFTYIDDVVSAVIRVMHKIPAGNTAWRAESPDPATSYAPYRLYNVGNHTPVKLSRFIEIIEKQLCRKAQKNYLPMQAGEVLMTYADVGDLISDINYQPSTSIEDGIASFISWYKDYYLK